jgi:hypothetical protein
MCEKRQNAESDTIAVTPKMIEVGLQMLYESGAIENPVEGADRSLLQAIFRAMHEARQT